MKTMNKLYDVLPGIYVHIPFCQSRCIYCDFYSTVLGNEVKRFYVDRLEQEFSQRSDEIKGPFSSLYIGGGTPSCLHPDLIKKIIDDIRQYYDIIENAEITVEINPDDMSELLVETLLSCGVNRVSLGVQTFDDNRLRFIQRRHNAKQAVEAVNFIFQSGIDNISVDLIYGFPDETIDSWKDDIDQALALPIRHLSAYSLMYEDGTKLSVMRDRGLISEVSDETSLRMFDVLIEMTENYGMEHYEISNFSLPGFRSRHNSKYWNSVPYIGFGAGAHSYDGNTMRRRNMPILKSYIASKNDVPHEIEVISEDERCDEFVFTSLRTCNGLDLGELQARFGLVRYDKVVCAARHYLKSGLLEEKFGCLCLTRRGVFLSDLVMSDLMIAE